MQAAFLILGEDDSSTAQSSPALTLPILDKQQRSYSLATDGQPCQLLWCLENETEQNEHQTRTTQTDRTMVEEGLKTFFNDGWGFTNGRCDYKPAFRVNLRKVAAILSS